MVYDEPDKSFIHKWLLLTDPDDPSSGAKVLEQTLNSTLLETLSSLMCVCVCLCVCRGILRSASM